MRIDRRQTLIGLGAGGLALSGCSGAVDTGVKGPLKGGRSADTLVRLGDAEIRTFDPHIFTELASARVAADQFVGLTRFDGRGEVIPALAGQWTVSADGLNWRFPVRDGLKFSDGAPITAAAIVGSIARMRDPKTASTHAAMAVNFVGVEDVAGPNDAGTVVITLAKPYPDLPGLLAHAAFAAVPLHRIAALGEGWTNERPLVTSGPYRATEWVLNKAITLERNPHWPVSLGTAAIPRVIWKPSESNLSAMRAFLGGEADIAGDFPPMRGEWLQAELNSADTQPAKIEPYLGSYYFVFNTSKPPFNDARVRTALNMTMEREWLIDKVLLSGTPPAYGLLPPGLVQVSGKDAPDFRPDWAGSTRPERLATAKALLAEAGYGPKEKGRNPLRFELRFNSSPDHRRICAAAAAMWADLGVEARLFNTESALHFDALRRADYALARSGWIADLAAPENFLENFMSDAGDRNYPRYANPKFDAAMAAALSEADPDARARAMLRAEALMMADSPILPLHYYVARALVHPRVTGWHANPMNVHPNVDLALEPVERAG